MRRQNLLVRTSLPLLKKKKLVTNYRKRFRSQFGRRPVLKAIEILKEKKKKHDCPSCSYLSKVKRIGSGRYLCSKCNTEFVSDSYSFLSKK